MLAPPSGTKQGRGNFEGAFARLMEPLITPSAKKEFAEDRARLKALAEVAPPEDIATKGTGTR
jgi:hypothetical protein